MYSEELKNIIETARIDKGMSQRELAKFTGINRTTLNDLINGKIKKIDVDSLKKIAKTLDISLEKLLNVTGYGDILEYLSLDRYDNKSDKDLKNIIESYEKSQLDLLDFDSKKRSSARKVSEMLVKTENKLEKFIKDNTKYSLEEIIKDISNANDIVKTIEEKYDYSKLPKSN